MIRYSIQPRDQTFVIKSYGFLSFVKILSNCTGKNVSKYLSGKCSQGTSWSC